MQRLIEICANIHGTIVFKVCTVLTSLKVNIQHSVTSFRQFSCTLNSLQK